MSYIFKKNIALKSNYGSLRNLSKIDYIVIHYTANDGDTDEGNANYFKSGYRGASAHYFTDDDSITQSVPDDYIAYSVGGSRFNDYKATGGATLYGVCKNANSISIEMCDTLKDGSHNVSEATLANTVVLVKELMAKYSIPLSNVVRHFDVTGKPCPSYFISNDKWNGFKDRLIGYINYQGHIQDIGWSPVYKNGLTCGSTGLGKRLEAIKIWSNLGDIEYCGHVQDKGWLGWVSNGAMVGSEGEGKRLEAIMVRFKYVSKNIRYRVHVQDKGWMDWVSNGAVAGTTGEGKRIEAIQIELI